MQRHTQQQDAIQAVLEDTDRPLTPAEILERARSAVPRLGLATVYRALNRLQEQNAVVAVPIPGGSTRYEQADLAHHHHFVCTRCGRVYEVPGCADNIETLAPPGFLVHGHEITLSGICAACRKKT